MKCGIEIHQRIGTKKLFCNCNATMKETKQTMTIKRLLHPAIGETGELDKAVKFEAGRSKQFTYQVMKNNSCLVETDSEPPHEVNKEALITAISVAKHLKMFIPDEIHVMRKTVIDGSNTSGFQRTMVIGLGTKKSIIPTIYGPVRVKDLELEEESARIVSRDEKGTVYNLSGLGVPLIEIGTYPDIKSPEQAYETALYIGELLRLTGKAQRGIGTIRQDVNISVKGGARVEIKGFQELKELPDLIRNEIKRQESLIQLKNELTGYELKRVNVTNFFEKSKSRIIKGKKLIMGLILPGFKGLLARKLNDLKTLGSELADYARAQGVKGMIHEDEDLSKYGLEVEFIKARNELELNEDDLLLIISGNNDKIVNNAIRAVENRVYLLNDCVPEETRIANKDGSSSYSRPLPGGARMYPETDVPVIKPLSNVPVIETKKERMNRLEKLGLTKEMIKELILNPKLGLFDKLVKQGLKPVLAFKLIIMIPKDVKRRKKIELKVSDEQFIKLAKLIIKKQIIMESIPSILMRITNGDNLINVTRDFKQLSDEELKKIINKTRKQHKNLTIKALMGLVMKETRGRASGKKIMRLLK